MPTSTYDLIASNVLSSSASSVTFSSISGSYRDLVVVATPISSSTGGSLNITVNGDTGSNYSRVLAEANGSSTGSNSGTSTSFFAMWNYQEIGTSPSPYILQLLDYSATNKHKTLLVRANNPTTALSMAAGRWANTNAITSITLTGGFAANSSFYLYGIVA
jgi:hypothetical protein